jgi:hypothetical protein
MKVEAKPASAEPTKASRIAEKTRKVISGYSDIKHFCQARLQYTRPLEKDRNPAFELGYN